MIKHEVDVLIVYIFKKHGKKRSSMQFLQIVKQNWKKEVRPEEHKLVGCKSLTNAMHFHQNILRIKSLLFNPDLNEKKFA